MGHKVHPTGFRLGIIRDWQSKWYADEHYAQSLHEDLKIRRAVQTRYAEAAISLVEIERQAKEIVVTIHTARPGIVIGRGGQRVDELRSYLEGLIGKKVRLNIKEVRQPELDALLVAKNIAEQIQRRIAYRRAMKQAIFRTMQAGAKGVRVWAAGRLGDAEIARRQIMHEGQVPLHTIRADIDYGFTEAHTTLGRIGIKVWINKGEIYPEVTPAEEKPAEAAAVADETGAPSEVLTEEQLKEKLAVLTETPTAAPVAKEKKAPTAEEKKAPAPVETTEAVAEVKKPARRTVRKPRPATEVETAKDEAKPVAKEAKPLKAEGKAAAEKKPVRRRKTKATASTEETEKPVS